MRAPKDAISLPELSRANAWGGCEIRPTSPGVDWVEDVYYLPFGFNTPWGIFDSQDWIVPASVDYSHPTNEANGGQILESNFPYRDITETAPDANYVYGGKLSWHFGHFIIETLPRLWRLSAGRTPDQKIIMHGEFELQSYFELSFVRDMLGALNITRDDIVHSARPFKIGRLEVPHTSFQPQAFGHPAFADLCRAIGRKILPNRGRTRSRRPVYLSKTRLPLGITRIVNEKAFEHVLARNGVDVVYPEELAFVDQLRLFAERRVIAGVATSAFHTSLFTPVVGRLEIISPVAEVNSNYFLIDALCGNAAHYYHVESAAIAYQAGHPFSSQWAFVDPDAAAKAFAERLWLRHDKSQPAVEAGWLSRLGLKPR